MRDRLIELLNKKYDHFCDQCGVNKDSHYTDSLADYLIENGVIVPPCKVGDKVYDISEFFDGTNCPEIYEYDVQCIYIEEEKGKQIFYIADLKYPSDEWGKTLHFSREEAEKVLKGGVE